MQMTQSDPNSSYLGRLRAKLHAGDGLKAHVFRGGTWLGMGSVFEQLFRFGRNMLLTRLLFPEAFGMMAIIYSVGAVVYTLTEIGVKEALIQHPLGKDERYVNSAWWLAFGRGLGLYVVLFTAAPFLAKFYGNAQLAPLARVALLTTVFLGAQSSKAFVALKEMKFKRWAFIEYGGGACGSIIVVVLALLTHSVWALAIGYAGENFMRCALSYVICPFVPKFKIDRESIRELLKFSKGVFGLSLLNLIYMRTDVFVLGKMFPAAQLGVYTMGIYLIQVPSSFLMNVINQTLVPSFARIQDDHARINRIVRRATATLIIVGMPVLIFMVVGGRGMLALLYGSRYASAYLPLMVAAMVSLVDLTNGLITMVFYAKGVPQFHRRCVFIMAVMMMILVYPAVRYFGFVGGQLAALISVSVGYVSQLFRIRSLTGLDFAEYSRPLSFAIAVGLGILAVFFVIRQAIATTQPLWGIGLGALGCAIALAICSRLLLRQLMSEA
jgi:PST family polysaccharide transporter/lipopolysaccharide exporter